MKILTIIPAYNEEKSITSVIANVRRYVPESDILVVNDGSSDNTALYAAAANAMIINLPFNLGIGGAMQTGYMFARDNNYDIAIQVDGDGQHNPSDIQKLVKPVIDNLTDMAIGSRYISRTSYRSSYLRRIGMIFFSALVAFLTGNKVKDTTSGFRVVNRNIINYFAKNYPTDYPEVDVLVKLHKKGFRIMEIPVEMNRRQNGKSSITPFRSVYYMIKVSISILIDAIRPADSQ
ncbi:MAG TPA: glycosyltransferase family 2 protein [Clostridiaceae bacterium]|nr:glycosyltransferase family 2 protein [Clostridiaceae bacterium]